MAQGDHLRVRLLWKNLVPYWHHGIELSDGSVVHYTSQSDAGETASTRTREQLDAMEVKRTSIAVFADGKRVQVVRHRTCFDAQAVEQRALSQLGSKAYTLNASNCEHFARWCKSGDSRSWQIEQAREFVQVTASAVTKVSISCLASRSLGRVALQACSKRLASVASVARPIYLLADAAEAVAYCAARQSGCSKSTQENFGNAAGIGTAAMIGFSTGGPAGATAAISLHQVTRWLGQKASDKLATVVS